MTLMLGLLTRRGPRPSAGPVGGELPTLGSGGDLAAAMNAATSGDTIVLEAGGVYDITPGTIGNGGKTLTIRTQNGTTERALIRSGSGSGNDVCVRDKDDRWKWLPREGVDISANGGNPAHAAYVGPHVQPDGMIDLSAISSAKCAGETALRDWPAGANPLDYETIRGQGGAGFQCTGGVLTLQGLRIQCFEDSLIADAGLLVVDGCVVIGGRRGVDMNGAADVVLRDSLFFGGAQGSWTWREVKSGELDAVGKRTWVNCKDASGTLTVRRCTALDWFDGIVGNPSAIVIDIDQLTLDGRTDDLEQVQASTRGDMTVRRCRIRATATGGNSTSTGPDTVSRVFEDNVVTNFRALYDHGQPRWRVLHARHNSPVDPVTCRRNTYIERGGTNSNGTRLVFVFGAPWSGNSNRPQAWLDCCLVMATSQGLIGRDYDRAAPGGLDISGSAILKLAGASLSFADGGNFATWKSRNDASAERITDTGYTADQLFADPRLISQRFGRTVGAIAGDAATPFADIGDPNDWTGA